VTAVIAVQDIIILRIGLMVTFELSQNRFLSEFGATINSP